MPTINTRAYTADRTLPDAITYVGPAKTLGTKDDLSLSRAYPKPQGSFRGVAKPEAKLVKTVIVSATTGETADAIFKISASLPVGMTSADIDTLLADGASFCAAQFAKDLFKALDINA